MIQHSLEHCPIITMGNLMLTFKKAITKEKINKNY